MMLYNLFLKFNKKVPVIRYFYLFCLFTASLSVAAQEPIIHFKFDEASGETHVKEDINNLQLPVFNLFNSPQRIPAIQGSALRFDGFSTYIQENYTFQGIDKAMTIEAWYVTEAFSPSTDPARNPVEGGAIISQIQSGSGFALKIGSYGNIIFDFHAGASKYTVITPRRIQKYFWNHIVATIDLEAKNAKIYVNGNLWNTTTIEEHNLLSFATAPLLIGRHNSSALIEGFNINTLNGAIDDLKIYNVALQHHEIVSNYSLFAQVPSEIELFDDFESNDYGSWTVEGSAFSDKPANGTLAGQNPVQGFLGNQLVNSFYNGDISTGKLTSVVFQIEKSQIDFLVGGGNHPGKVEIRLVINDQIVRMATGHNSETLRYETWDVEEFIGLDAKIVIVDEVTGGWGHILVDHITFTNKQELIAANLFVDLTEEYKTDYLRPRYHSMPNSNWTNEPYGLTYYDGKYHLFFQKNPSGLWLHFMHWGHLSSPDLVHWKEEKIALGPDPGFDEFGIWSGTTIKDANGVPVIFYTGVDLGRAGIGAAFPKDNDLIEWEKYDRNPVIPGTVSGYLDFRDPFLWQDNGNYYMIVGTGFAGDLGGALLTYKSSDLLKWTRIANLHSSNKVSESGFFWEMPLFYPLNDKGEYILAITPLYKNKGADVKYWIGKWENEKFAPYFEIPKIFEGSRDNMLAPAIGTDEAERITYIGIVPETRNAADQLKSGWRHIFSLPRVIRLLQDSTIGQYPHPHLCRLKENEKIILDRSIQAGTSNNLPEFEGNQIALSYKVKADSASHFSLQVLKNASGNKYASMIFDLSRNLIALDTRNANIQSAFQEYTAYDYIFDHTEEINVEVFVDHSVVEVFIDNLLVVSMRCYPAETSQLVDLVVNTGSVQVLEARQWTMKNIGDNTESEICEPEYLPAQFRKTENNVVTGADKVLLDEIRLYPNPAKQVLMITSSNTLINCNIDFYTITGKTIKSLNLDVKDSTINISDLPEGLYVVAITSPTVLKFFKIYIHQ